MRAASFIITTSAQGSSRTQLWESHRPLTLGHPFQWMIERTPNGARVRDLSIFGRGPVSVKEALREIPEDKLNQGATIELPVGEPGRDGKRRSLQLSIRPAVEQAPAFTSRKGSTLTLYECVGHWVTRSLTVRGTYQARSGEAKAFKLSTQGDQLRLEPQASQLRIQAGDDPARDWKEALTLSAEQAAHTTIYSGLQSWRFGLASAPEFVDSKQGEKKLDPAYALFQKSLRATGVAMAAFVVMTILWPKPKEDPKELIPPQFAKIVMTAPKAPASAGSPDAGASAPMNDVQKDVASKTQNAPKKVQQAAVVQAFRAQALSHAVSGLLKGGMTNLLAQSDFVNGAAAAENARSMFNSKSASLQATAPNGDLGAGKSVAVASLGGSGGSGGVGYGKGDKAGVKGQGGAFVSMDTGNASVDEGLTKDEVGEVIHRHMSEVRYCYESAMLRQPDIEGKLMTAFVIGGNGMVKSTEVKSSTLPDPRLDDCILRRLVTWKFPNPRGGVDVAVSYPFIFKSLGR